MKAASPLRFLGLEHRNTWNTHFEGTWGGTMNWLDWFPAESIGSWEEEVRSDAPPPWDAVLESLCAGLPLENSQALREERAGVLEFDAGKSREEAERLAGIVAESQMGAA